jgi:hypothetical protein
VRDLHQIIDGGARADDRVAHRAAIDRAIAADLHIVFDDHAAQLRDAQEACRARHETETFAADADIRRDD